VGPQAPGGQPPHAAPGAGQPPNAPPVYGQPPGAGQPWPNQVQDQPGWQQQPQWQHPPPPGWQQPAWGRPPEPDNGPAVTGFVLAMVSAGLWIITAGLATLLSLGLAIAGLIVSRNGKRNVSEGKTTRNKGLAQAGFISSIVMIVLASLSTLAWIAFFVVLATDEDFRREFENDNQTSPFDSDGMTTTVRLGVVAVRVAAHLVT
jgi:hypothetical protein